MHGDARVAGAVGGEPGTMARDTGTRGVGWGVFAGTLFLLVGIFNVIDGFVAIQDSHYLVNDLIFGSLHSWGWTIFILGIIQFIIGVAVISGQAWAMYVGIVSAVLDAIGQLLFLRTYPVWSIIIIAVDIIIIYGLATFARAVESGA